MKRKKRRYRKPSPKKSAKKQVLKNFGLYGATDVPESWRSFSSMQEPKPMSPMMRAREKVAVEKATLQSLKLQKQIKRLKAERGQERRQAAKKGVSDVGQAFKGAFQKIKRGTSAAKETLEKNKSIYEDEGR